VSVAALYDIHGNLPALEAVLDEIARLDVDRLVIGGDVMPGPMVRECLARLRDVRVPVDCIHGNGESAVLGLRRGGSLDAVPAPARDVVRWVANELPTDDERQIASWPMTMRLAIPGLGDVLFCHATPRSDTEIFTRLTPDDRVRPMFESVAAALVVCGHTHMQFDRTVGSVRIVNAGSVGMPFGAAGAHWLRLGPGVEFRRTDYDLARAAAEVRRTRYPGAVQFADRHILQPPTEEEMLRAFGGS
jgi:predicted phosphodiesterase